MPRGRCLCGDVTFEVGPLTDIELCHCVKCRRAYGAAYAATVYAKASTFRWVEGEGQVGTYDAPLEDSAPAYRHSFCRRCGSPLPLVWESLPFVELPVACLEDQVPSRPAYQMFESQRLTWIESVGGLRWHVRGAPLREKVVASLL